MHTHIHVSGLSYFCTDDTLRQAFMPFGVVVRANVLRDEWGHSLGLGIVHMASPGEVERIFNAHQRFEIAGSRVDLWEPAEPGEFHGGRILAENRGDVGAAQASQETACEMGRKSRHPLAGLMRRLIQTLVPSSRTV